MGDDPIGYDFEDITKDEFDRYSNIPTNNRI
jgi:hypothetical protein